MPILQSIVNTIGALYPRYGGSGWPFSTVVIPGARYDYEANAGQLYSNSVVAIAIKWLGDRFPRACMRVNKVLADGKYKPIANHPVQLLWKRPNPFYTRRAMEKAIGLSLITDGNAYVQKVRNGAGKVAELWWVPSSMVYPYWENDDFITGYSVIVPGRAKKDIDRSEIIHIRDGMDPLNPRKGLSALNAQLREVSAINEEGSYTPSILRNSGIPGLVIVPKDPNMRVKKEDADTIKERVADATRGEKRGSTVVLQGMYDVTSIGFSPEQLALDKIMQLPMAKVAGACGVALMSMGLPDPGKTYSNLDAANKYSWGTVCAIQEMIGDAIGHDLLPEFGFDPLQYAIDYDYDDVQELQEEAAALWDRVAKGWEKSIITQNEARDLIGMDKDPEGDRYYYEIQTSIALARNPQQTLAAVEAEATGQGGNVIIPPSDATKPPALPSPNGNRLAGAGKGWHY